MKKFRRVSGGGNDDGYVGPLDEANQTPTPQQIRQRVGYFLDLYDEALPQVYGYVHRRVPSTLAAEDITAETFLAAVATIKNGRLPKGEPIAGDDPGAVTIPWLIGVARHKVADHWRRQASDDRRVDAATREAERPTTSKAADGTDRWDAVLDATLARDTLNVLSPNHRAVLSLRYLDGLPVGEIAHLLGRTPGATEALLTRAKAAFRAAYPHDGGDRV